MKELIYRIYALIFNFCSKAFKIKNNRVALVSMHNEGFNDSLGRIKEELEKRGSFDFVYITRQDLEVKIKNIPRVFSFFFAKSRKLATAKYVFLNDNFLPMCYLHMKKEAEVIQLWHAEGVFKKFGFAISQNTAVREREKKANEKITKVVCSSKAVAPYYAQAFGKEEKDVLPLGVPRCDFLFESGKKEKALKRLYGMYPELKGKKLVLYAPTFRESREKNKKLLSYFNFSLWNEKIGNTHALLLRLHPQIHEDIEDIPGIFNMTDFDDVTALILACDVLVTDYSSICMDFSLLNKKTVFFAFDKEDYINDRDFYFPYDSYVPGMVVTSTEDLIEEITEPVDTAKNEKFRNFNFDFQDGNSAKRVVDYILSNH